MRTVVLVSADAEWRVVKSLLQISETSISPVGEYFGHKVEQWPVTVFHGGWGRVSAAATTQYVIDKMRPDLIINLGTCGGFEGRIERGAIILAVRTIIYDILEQMTDPAEAIEHYSTTLKMPWLPRESPTPVKRGLLVSGDRDIVAGDITGLIDRYGAVAADWESGAIAWVADKNSQPLLILRGVSDLVGNAGGEAYGAYELFIERTRGIMGELFAALPIWLSEIERQLPAR